MSLNSEQSRVVDSILEGKNVFITGSAGVGKSFLVKHLTDLLQKASKVFRVLAPTGVAATNIGGMTIHRFLGLIPSVTTREEYVIKMMKNCKESFNDIDVIFIDEISMVTPSLFQLMDDIIRLHIPSDKRPFAGIQMVLLGDLFQLPFIPEKSTLSTPIFDSALWNDLNLSVHQLEQVMRQDDPVFITALNDLRLGIFSNNLKRVLKTCINNKREPDKHYVRLFPLNVQRQFANETELAKLKTESRIYRSNDFGQLKCLDGHPAVKTLVLKIGCPVMLLRNLQDNLYNGSLGTVVEFDAKTNLPRVLFENGCSLVIAKTSWEITADTKKKKHVIAGRVQLPLAVAYSLSVHKSQGLTISHLEVDLRGIFTTGQMYVALSRAKTISGLIVKNFSPSQIQVDPRVLEWHNHR